MQQLVGAVAAYMAGQIVTEGAGGHIDHYPTLGIILVVTSLVTRVQIYFINRQVNLQLEASTKAQVR